MLDTICSAGKDDKSDAAAGEGLLVMDVRVQRDEDVKRILSQIQEFAVLFA